MLVYHLLSAAVLLSALPLLILPRLREKDIEKKKTPYIFFVFSLLFLAAALRYGIGHDYIRYLDMIKRARAGETALVVSSDRGFSYLLSFLTGAGMSDLAIMGLLALLCLVPVAWFIRRYSPNLWLSVWLYLTMTFYYCSLNFIRQSLAAGVLLLGTPLLEKRKPWAYFAYLGVIGLACVFHTTALLMVPLALFSLLPLNRFTLTALGVGDLLLVLLIKPLLDVFSLRQDGEYYFLNYHIEELYLTGLSPVFLVVPLLVAALLVAALPRIQQRFGDAADLPVKMTLFGACFWSFVPRFFILERFSLYGYLYLLVSVPMAVEALRPLPPSGKLTREQKQRRSSEQAVYLFVLMLVLAISEMYNLFGMAEGFHGVFPYVSWV